MPVPDTTDFSLQDVVDVINPAGDDTLVQCFADSIDDFFDPTYKGSKDKLSNFRNYGGSTAMWFQYTGGGNGFVDYSHATWATCRGASIGDNVDIINNWLVYADKPSDYVLSRGFLRFDLSIIPATAVCEEAGIGLDIVNTFGTNIACYGYVGTQAGLLTADDFDAFTFADYTMSNWVDTPGGHFADFDVALLASGSTQLGKIEDAFGGYLYIALINFGHDESNSAPTGKNGVEIFRAGEAATEPFIRVVFTI